METTSFVLTEDTLPNYNDQVILVDTDDNHYYGYRSHTDRQGEHYRYCHDDEHINAEIRYWLPIPKLPKR